MKTKCPFCGGIDWEEKANDGTVFFLSGHKEEDISMLSDGKWCVDLTEKYTDKLYLYGVPVHFLKCKSCGFLAIFSTFP